MKKNQDQGWSEDIYPLIFMVGSITFVLITAVLRYATGSWASTVVIELISVCIAAGVWFRSEIANLFKSLGLSKGFIENHIGLSVDGEESRTSHPDPVTKKKSPPRDESSKQESQESGSGWEFWQGVGFGLGGCFGVVLGIFGLLVLIGIMTAPQQSNGRNLDSLEDIDNEYGVNSQNPFSVRDVNFKVSEKGTNHWDISWMVEIRNNTSQKKDLYVEVSFLDRDGFQVEYDNESTSIGAFSTQKVTGTRMMDAGKARQIETIEVDEPN